MSDDQAADDEPRAVAGGRSVSTGRTVLHHLDEEYLLSPLDTATPIVRALRRPAAS
jgi:hypothetical protein